MFFCGYIFVCLTVTAQNANLPTELKKAQQLRLTYQFDDALAIFNKLLREKTDSVFQVEILREITLCENGKNMIKFTASPAVIACEKVSLKEFYHYYDLSLPGFWSLTPTSLSKEFDKSEIKPFIYVSSKNPDIIYFDAYNMNGNNGWNIYETHRMPNNEWSAPERLSEIVNTPFDERFPYLCPDGRTLYFASNGHYGMGGYDLYKTEKDLVTGEWSIPENLGFPFSSTADDMLYVPDADNLYACFASTRNAGKDSIAVYKIALEGTLVKQPLSQWTDIMAAAMLRPASTYIYVSEIDDVTDADKTDTPEVEYQRKVQELQKIRQHNSFAQTELDQLRTDYSKTTDAQERSAIAVKIEIREQTLNQYQRDIQQLNKEIQELEYASLAQGVVYSPLLPPMAAETVSKSYKSVALVPHPEKIINLPDIVVQAPITVVPETKDFTLRTNTESQIFYNEAIEGINYRYQIGVFSKRPDTKIFKGYTPAFIDERNGKWVCSIGLFRTYGEAQKCSNTIKRAFNDAMLVALKNSKPIEIRLARVEEGKKPAGVAVNKNEAYQIVLGQTLPDNLLKTVQKATSKEIARIVVNGKTQYVVGPYNNKDEADKVVKVLQQSGFNAVRLETVERKS